MQQLLTDEYFASFRGDGVELQCPEIRLEFPHAPEIVGVGSLRFAPDAISFACYLCSDAVEGTSALWNASLPSGKAGTLITDEQFVRVVAIDESQRHWIFDRVLITTRVAGDRQTPFLATGQVGQVECVERLFPDDIPEAYIGEELLELYILDKGFQFPANTSLRRTFEVDGEKTWAGTALSVARFKANDCTVTIADRGEFLKLEAVAPKLPANAVSRIVESLQFVLGQSVVWCASRFYSGNSVRVAIKAGAQPHDARPLHPPILFGTIEYKDMPVWPLCARYLEFVCRSESPNWHAVSRHVYTVIASQRGDVFVQGLALGVAVEGILGAAFSDSGSLPEDKIAAIDEICEWLAAWRAEEPELKWLRDRAFGAVQSFRQPTARARLRELQQAGVVSSREIRSWQNLRNRTAHGNQPDRSLEQRDFDEIGTVLTLMYKLVMKAIGYAGPFTDYSEHGWPTKRFGRLGSSE